jgi:shikimate dehydrogenase
MKNSFYTNTKLIGLIGHPIKQSYSPFIHNIAAQFKNIDYIYLPFDVVADNLKDALKGFVALGISGLNVTIPHKEKIIKYLDDLSEEAAMIGAVNTIVNEHGKLKGYNTDINGILESLTEFKDLITGSKVSVIGAGGGARAIIYTLIRYFKPEQITIINRTIQRADTLHNYFSEKMRFDNLQTADLFPPDLVETFWLLRCTLCSGRYGCGCGSCGP